MDAVGADQDIGVIKQLDGDSLSRNRAHDPVTALLKCS